MRGTSIEFALVFCGGADGEGLSDVKDKEAQELRIQDDGGVGWVVCAISLVEDTMDGRDKVACEVATSCIPKRSQCRVYEWRKLG